MPAGGICLKTSTSPEAASNVMAITEGWEKFSANENEAKSLYDFLKHLELGLSPYMWSRFKT